jgi:hypothetical protein
MIPDFQLIAKNKESVSVGGSVSKQQLKALLTFWQFSS